MSSAGRVVCRDELMEELYGREATPFDRSVDMHISHLRKKPVPADESRERIRSVRGAGAIVVAGPRVDGDPGREARPS